MCGDSHSFHIPDYIFYNEEEYPHIQAKSPYFSSMYGDVDYLVLNNPSLMERERKVLQKIMEYVVTYNQQNGNKNPLIGFQVHNEADGLLRWRLDQQKLKMNDMDMTPEKIWEMTLQALDNAGQAIKNSTYQIYTRCNMTVTLGVEPFPQFSDKSFSPLDVLSLKGNSDLFKEIMTHKSKEEQILLNKKIKKKFVAEYNKSWVEYINERQEQEYTTEQSLLK